MSKSFYNRATYTIEDLNSLIINEIEESVNLDFKSARSLDKSDRKKTEIAKDVSAFANSDGGIIIYGLEEENHKPTEISFVDGNLYNKEWLENIIDGNIQQRISGIEIFPIRIDNKIEQTVYIVKIPSSENAPHICSDKKYYRRFNFKSVPMEEYEIRLLYNKKSKSEIKYKTSWCQKLPEENIDGEIKLLREISIHVKNTTNTLEKNCKIEVYFNFDNDNTNLSFTYARNSNVSDRIFVDGNLRKMLLTAYNISPIFPGEEFNIINFTLIIPKKEYSNFWKNGSMTTIIYDSNHTNKTESEISSFFHKPE